MEHLVQLRKQYKKAKRWVWAQEEPENMGAWPFILRKLRDWDLECVARTENASPATGFTKSHLEQQQHIINAIFD